jgi:hypothetical protein
MKCISGLVFSVHVSCGLITAKPVNGLNDESAAESPPRKSSHFEQLIPRAISEECGARALRSVSSISACAQIVSPF